MLSLGQLGGSVEDKLTQGRRHGFESGGGQFCEWSEQKIFFGPPTFWPVWGTKYCLDS